MSTKAPGEILELFRGGYLSIAETIDALDTVEGYVSVELLNIERAISDDLREQNAKLREAAAVGGEASIPTYGNLPWDQLGRDVMEANMGTRCDFEFDPKFYPGHQSVSLNFNSLARIVDKYRIAAPPASPLRGREMERCLTCRHTDEEYAAGERICVDPWHADDHLRAKSASPPEQPAAARRLACRRCAWGTIRLGNGDRETCDLCHGTGYEPAAAPFQPHENCNCLMCLAEKPR